MDELVVGSLAPSVEHENQLAAAGALLDKLKEALSQLNIPLPPKDQVLAMVSEAYDAYVAPIDLPGVPNIVEPWVDSAIKAVVLQMAGRIYDKVAS